MIDPNEDEEMRGKRYLLSVTEKQAYLIFNEVAKAEAADNLCLPMIFSLQVSRKKDMPVSMLDEYVSYNQMSQATKDAFNTPNIIDFKYVLRHGHTGELVVPFDVPRIGASVLVS